MTHNQSRVKDAELDAAEVGVESKDGPASGRTGSEYGVIVQGLGKCYGEKWVVDHVSFKVESGSFLSILGPSGCGKSTSLRLIAGLDRPDSGEVWIGGVSVSSKRGGLSVPAAQRNIGFVFQSYALWPHMTVFEHVAYPLHSQRLRADLIRSRVDRTLELVGLGDHRLRYPSELSGGQQQRVALARAVVHEPAILLLDEPLSNLDAGLRARMGVEVRNLQKTLGITTIYVTHDRVEALSLSDQVMVMQDGHAVEFGTPTEVYEHPIDVFSAQFVGGANILPGTVLRADDDGAHHVQLGHGHSSQSPEPAVLDVAPHTRGLRLAAGDDVAVAVRPESIILTPGHLLSGPNLLHATVEKATYFGGHSDVVVKCGTASISARVNQADVGFHLDPGADVAVFLPPTALCALPRA